MAELRAFRGIRYTPSAGPLGNVTAPPYDVIGQDMRARLAARNARNIVHLILPEGGPERYRTAAEKLETWLREGQLAQEREPSLYLYRQSFSGPDSRMHVRTGFLGLLRLEGAGGSVRHHEQTLAQPLADRLRMLRATRTQLSPIFVLYSDPSGSALRALEACSTKERPATRSLANEAYGRRASELRPGAVQEFNDDEGVRHWLQPISDEHALAEASNTLARVPVVIADGHHRYSAALEFVERMRRAFPDDDPDLPENFMLACFVRAEDPGLIVLPTHRVVLGNPQGQAPKPQSILEALADRFEIESLDVPASAHAGGAAMPLGALPAPQSAEPGGRVVIGARLAGDPRLHVLVLKQGEATFAKYPLEAPLRGLDVSVLHTLILRPQFGIDEEALRRGGALAYERDAARAAAQVASGEARAAFFLRPVPTSAVFDITSHGLTLPQKSTYFAPKIASGLVLHRLGA